MLDDTYWVRIKAELSVEDHDFLINRFVDLGVDPANREQRRAGLQSVMRQNVKLEMLALLEVCVVDWNFPDPENTDKIIELSAENLAKLDLDLATRIHEEVKELDPLGQVFQNEPSKPTNRQERRKAQRKKSLSTPKQKDT